MELSELWSILVRRWATILALLVVGVLVALGISYLTPTKYAATSEIFVGTKAASGADAYAAAMFSTQRVNSYVHLADSDQVTAAVVKKLKLGAAKADDLRSAISASVVQDTVVMDITVTWPDAKQAERIARETATQLTKEINRVEAAPDQKKALFHSDIIGKPTTATKVSPRLPINLLAGGLIGLLVGLAVAVIRRPVDHG